MRRKHSTNYLCGGADQRLRYQGGKDKISKQISSVIMDEAGEGKTFVSLFCGALNVESKIKGFDKIICNDNNYYLIELFRALQNGYELPDNLSREEYYYIKEHKDENPALTAFAAFGCSFGGKWFAGYAKNNASRNYAYEAKKGLAKKMSTLMDATFTCLDYRDVILPDGCVIYADPPYNGTTGISGQDFDTDKFWDYMREMSENHNVYISELVAPDDFECIWHKDVTRTLDVNADNYFRSTEKLFVHKSKTLQ